MIHCREYPLIGTVIAESERVRIGRVEIYRTG